jgi:hypothetical protein
VQGLGEPYGCGGGAHSRACGSRGCALSSS